MNQNYTKEHFIDDKKRTLVLVLPGGGYEYTSEREAGPIADFFNRLGYHSSIFYYRENKLKYPEIFQEAKMIVDAYKKHPLIKNIIVIGFSAGGHFASYLLTVYKDDFKAGILCYPVISSDPAIRHEGSFFNLLKDLKDEKALYAVSTDLRITDGMPPIFIWHTETDGAVPVENTKRFVRGLKEHHVAYELRLFPKGGHGLSLITPETVVEGMDVETYINENKEVQIWTEYLKAWLLNLEAHHD